MFRKYSMKPDLNKLSLDQLAEYVKRQQAIEAAKKVVQKPIPKPVPKTKSKLETIRDKIFTSSRSVIKYPKKLESIAKMREEELNMTTTPGKLKMTFAELFDRCLKTIPGRKTRIQITVHTEVRYSLGITSGLESKSYGPFNIIIPKLSKMICTNLCYMYYSQMDLQFYRLKRLKRLEPQ